MAIPAAFTEARNKLQRTCQQGDRATQGVQRKRDAPPSEIVDFRRKGHVRQQVAQSPQRVLESEEREDEPQEFRQEFHVGSFSHIPRAAGLPPPDYARSNRDSGVGLTAILPVVILPRSRARTSNTWPDQHETCRCMHSY